MARKIEVPELKTAQVHIWEKLTGKYHTRETTVLPGQTFIAGKDTFINDPAGWKYIGPVEPVEG